MIHISHDYPILNKKFSINNTVTLFYSHILNNLEKLRHIDIIPSTVPIPIHLSFEETTIVSYRSPKRLTLRIHCFHIKIRPIP